MSFYGESFIFNGISSSDYGLMVYDIGGSDQSSTEFASTVKISEEYVGTKWKPYFYGVTYDQKLEHEITFGINSERIDADQYLTRPEIEEIATWLTGHDGYKVLEIEQEDMTWVRYKCIVTKLSVATYGRIPYTFKATFTCDSPYAYEYPRDYNYVVSGTRTVHLFNESSVHGFYYPVIEIINPDSSVTIENLSDNGRTFALTDIPASISRITVNNDTKVITNDQSLNLYDNCNYLFFRLVRGSNKIRITGNCTVKITCEFPVNTGA